ncbi:LacI family DNA-binding transcriptional regulator [Luteipulveratus mongoliensis]|uniref:HTH lacI-type domain-containing protein n=1 Tax=Luteipulveratus mongoliensis TaxID=571913 RepID=A0A0K1JGZ8_9MICO|nr:LacI family DNA-binding transcriptional regulator [Luteipulveratus mongoliensis]AKU15858.1 hypothetical protein VV02_08330 [Luteipulveratus mongoliensis]
MTSPPTIRTVAEHAGVSVATVSQVLSGRAGATIRVGEQTRERVLASVEKLGYVPNQAARGMRRGRTDQVCLVLHQLDTPWSRAMTQAVADAVSPHGYSTVILADGDWERYLMRQGADAAFIDAVGPGDADRLRTLAARGVSIVAYGNGIRPEGFDVVRTEGRAACEEAVAMLASRHARIALLRNGGSASLRTVAFRHTMRKHGLTVDRDLVRVTHSSRDIAYREAISLLQMADRPTAIFATSDLAAMSALAAAHRLGVRVPDDLEIIGVGNSPEGEAADPPLTSVGADAIFTDIAQMLLERLQSRSPITGRTLTSTWTVHRRGTTR